MWDVARLQWYDQYWWQSHGRPADRKDHSFSASFPLLEPPLVQAYTNDMSRLMAALQAAFPQVGAARAACRHALFQGRGSPCASQASSLGVQPADTALAGCVAGCALLQRQAAALTPHPHHPRSAS